MVANALAADPETAMNPERVTIANIFGRRAVREGEPGKEGAPMSTVVSRSFRSTPQRDAHDTWLAIVDF